jgi:Flp pilus assembly pilin Flp
MPINAIRLQRLALLLVLVSVGLIFKLVVLMRALRSAPKELAAMVPSRPHAPPA